MPAAPRDPESSDPIEDTKAKLRDALERKRNHRHPHESAGQGDGKVDHAARAAGGKRAFRRKSG